MRIIAIAAGLLFSAALVSFSPAGKLAVSSSAFKSNGPIPEQYSCKGEEVNPPLTIGNIPAAAKSLAIIVHDPDAPKKGGMTHWVIWNIDPMANIPENFRNEFVGWNGAGEAKYIGMCPASGTHHYHFMVYALDDKLAIPITTDKTGLELAMKGHVLASGDLVGLFSK